MLKAFIRVGKVFIFGLAILSITSSFVSAAETEIYTTCPEGAQIMAPGAHQDDFTIPALPNFDRVLLVPGAGAQNTDLYVGPIHWQKYFEAYLPFLEKAGIPYTLHSVSKTGDETVETRYDDLIKEIRKFEKKHERILIIGHSMGGLIGRLVLRDSSTWKTVVGVIQLSTPNQGTDLVDTLLKSDSRFPWVSILSKLVGFDINKKEYLQELGYRFSSQNYMTEADSDPKMPPVYSIVASDSILNLTQTIPLLGLSGKLIQSALKKLSPQEYKRTTVWGTLSDGVVPAYSQVWGYCLGWFHGSHAKILGKVVLQSHKEDFARFMTQLTALLKPHTLKGYEKLGLGASLSSSPNL